MEIRKRKLFYQLAIVIGIVLIAVAAGTTGTALAGEKAEGEGPPQPSIDHSSFPALAGPFETPNQVTQACLSCHTGAAEEIMSTVHWTWEYTNEVTGQVLGKKNLINNFCISIQTNEPRCTSCHVGYGWVDDTFDFAEETNVDCLVCHDTTGTYKKFPTGAGYPTAEEKEFPPGSGNIFYPPDLALVAQSIGLTSNETCGSCHFYGGGGDYVKHGDLDSSLTEAAFEVDVHLSEDGANFNCTTCHMTEDHQVSGSRYGHAEEAWQGCEECHTVTPHKLDSLNSHSQGQVSCQACHIPSFARGGNPTKMSWDWSVAGRLDIDGKPIVEKDEDGQVIYDGKKGAFTFESNVIPEYVWYNGNVAYTLAGEVVDPSGIIPINTFLGDKDDPNAKIYPVKVFQGKQPFDPVNNLLAIPHLFGKDEAAYWKSFDWGASIEAGMAAAGLPYSGEYDFVRTEMTWPTTHMVAPKTDALTCQDCHTAGAGRLDFAALGYSAEEAEKLTNFPPASNFEANKPSPSTPVDPELCSGCHSVEHELWSLSSHLDRSVGCVACHQLEREGQHPMEVAFTMEKNSELCGACHIHEYTDWETSIHSQYQVACVTCHNPHSQEQITVEDDKIACHTCHLDNDEETQHSTHRSAGLDCNTCHMNTETDTGHTWNVSSAACLDCHSESIHAANSILEGSDLAPMPVEETDDAADDEGFGAGFSIPPWAVSFFIIILGMAFTLIFGQNEREQAKSKEE